MSDQDGTSSALLTALARTLRCAVADIQVEQHLSRPYSNVWFVQASTPAGTLHIVAKSGRNRAIFDKQVRLLREAHAAFRDDHSVCIPYLADDADAGLLFMQDVCDPTLKQLCRVSLRRPLARWRDLNAACRQAGRWLRAWHEKTATRGTLAPLFDAYLAGRPECTGVLSPRDRDVLRRLIDSLGAEDLCVPHGDFTPPNVLWDNGKLTVLDFGVSEWNYVTPWWDRVAMEIGLRRTLGFNAKSLGFWVPHVSSSAVHAFRAGYGSGNGTQRAHVACCAIRHLTFYADDLQKGASYRRRAQWHWDHLQQALQRAEAKGQPTAP